MGRDAALLTQGVGSCIGGCAAALRTTGNTVVVLVGLAVVRARDVVAASDTAQVGVITLGSARGLWGERGCCGWGHCSGVLGS